MPEKNPLEPLLSQIGDLINKIQTHDKPLAEVSPEVLQKIEMLEKAFTFIEELNARVYQDAGVDIDKLRYEMFENPNLTPKDKRVLERAKTLENDAKSLKQQLEKALEGKKQPEKGDSKKERKKRKDKFKPLGGDRGWIPL